MNADYGCWLWAQIKTLFKNNLKNTGKALIFNLKIARLPPRWFRDFIFSMNEQVFDTESLVIVDIGNTQTHFSTAVDSGFCPKPFIGLIFGDVNRSTSVTTKNMLDKDVYNCNFEYTSKYGEFVFKCDIAIRTNSQLPWICLNFTTDKLN